MSDKICTSEVLHICRLDIHNVETLIANFQIPKVYPKIIGRYECFTITNAVKRTVDT
ncbi:hypothetical protein HanRHA438_Chr05g0217731 [Helianthus annuus]|nr:hypothetical protein HanIR_Chr05g0224281 [Helianthus annuus]KAJ0918418.1 hypothetical protein HanRHA438_Chr05g0217731 [Helianthus annuus]